MAYRVLAPSTECEELAGAATTDVPMHIMASRPTPAITAVTARHEPPPRVPVSHIQVTENVGWATEGWFSPDARTLATAGKANQLTLHDLQTGAATVAVVRPSQILSTAVSPRGNCCCTGDASGFLAVFELGLSSYPLKQRWAHQHPGKVQSTCFNSDGRLLFVVCNPGDGVYIHDAIAGGEPKRKLRVGSASQAQYLVFSGDLLAAVCVACKEDDRDREQQGLVRSRLISKKLDRLLNATTKYIMGREFARARYVRTAVNWH